MRLSTSEGGQQLEHSVALRTSEPTKHVFEKGLEATGDVGRGEEAVCVAVDCRDARQIGLRVPEILADQVVGQAAEIEREDIFGEVVRKHIGMQFHTLQPGASIGTHQ